MGFFSGSDDATTFGVLFDVGSGSVGVAIVKSEEGKKLPEVIYSERVQMRTPESKVTIDNVVRRMREALFSASLSLSKDGLRVLKEKEPKARVRKILVTCSSPWSHTVSRKVSYQHDQELKITNSLIDDLTSGAEEDLENNLEESTLVGSLGLQIVERATVDVQINGYSVHNPVGLQGKTISLSHITGLIQEEVLRAVYEVQEKIFPDTTISAHTFMLVNYCVLRDLFPKTHTLTIVDVTGEATEIGIVENGVLVDAVHTPYGVHTLIRKIFTKTGGTPEDAFSLIRAYSEQTLNEKSRGLLTEECAEYDEHFVEALEALHKKKDIPQTIVVTAPPHVRQFFAAKIPQLAEAVTKEEFTVLQLLPKVLDETTQKTNDDLFIALASRFFHKLHGCGEINTK